MAGVRFDDLDPLSLLVEPGDGRIIARGNTLYRAPLYNKLLVPPTLATFSTAADDTANSSAAVVTDNDFGIRMSKQNTTTSNVNDWATQYKAVPAGTNWVATCLMQRRHANRERFANGFILRQSSVSGDGGVMATIGWFTNAAPGGIAVAKWWTDGNALGDAVEQVMSREFPELCWFRIRRDNTSSKYVFYYSLDGDYFIELWRIPLTGGGVFSGTVDRIGVWRELELQGSRCAQRG